MSKTTKYNVKYKKFKDNVFEREVHLVVGTLVDARDFVANKLGIHGSPSDDSHGECISTDDGTFILWLEDWDGSPWWDGILAHEITHITFQVLTYVGVSYCDESEEVYAYYAGSLTKQIKQFLNKK